MQLEVVGPEARDHRDGRAVRREAEVGARQLHEDDAIRGRRQELGRRPQVPRARCRARVDGRTGGPEEIGEECGGRRLPGGPGHADRRHRRPFEHAIAEAPYEAAALAEEGDTRCDLRRPDVEECLVVMPRLGVEARARPDDDAGSAKLECLLRCVPRPGECHAMPLASERPGEHDGVAVEPLDEDPLHDRAGRGDAAGPPRPTGADSARLRASRSTADPLCLTPVSASAGIRGRPCSSPDRATATSPPCPSCRSGSTRARRRASRRRATPSSRRTSSRRQAPGSAR